MCIITDNAFALLHCTSLPRDQQIKLNDERLVYERTGDASASNIDGGHLRDVVKGAILGVDSGSSVVQMMDEDEAEEARKYFGVF